MKLSYLISSSVSPSRNLATEQYVFDCLPRDRSYCMLWQNHNTIVIGKYQNALAEINLPFVREHNIQVVRRLSGGGAVYHDLGNLNFTFITDADSEQAIHFQPFCQPILDALHSLGVPSARRSGRNDLVIDGKKFSGNSQYIRQGRVMHHGTILFHSDLSVLNCALRVDPDKIQSKGIRSVQSRVANLKEYLPAGISLADFRTILLEQILRENPGEEYVLTPSDLSEIEVLDRERYQSWDWNYGSAPPCTMLRRRRVEGCGLLEVYLYLERGVLHHVTFCGDFFSVEDPEILARSLIGLPPEEDAYRSVLDRVDVSRFFRGMDSQTLLDILMDR